MAMGEVAVAADTWVEATVGDAEEVTIAALGAAGLIVFIGAAEPDEDSKFGLPVPRDRMERLPVGTGEEIWLRSSIDGVATIALVMPFVAPE